MRRKNLSRSMLRVDFAFAAASSVARVSMMPSRRREARSTFGFSASRTPRTALPVEARTPRNSKTAMALLHRDVFLGGRQNLFDRGEPHQNLARPVVAQGVHALVHRSALDALRIGVFQNERTDKVVDHHQLVDAAATGVASLQTGRASFGAIERQGADVIGPERDV